MSRNRQQAWKNPGLLALLFCALLLRTFVPAGYMIGSVAAGAPALVLCPDAGPVAAPALAGPHHHHGHQPHHPAGHRESPCPFGALAAPALPSSPPLLAIQAPLPPSALQLVQPRQAVRGLAAPPPPSTGPPAFS